MTQKYEREIEEILRNLDAFVRDEPLPRRALRRVSAWHLRIDAPQLQKWRRYLTVQWMMVASIALVMFGFVIRAFSPLIASYANLLGLILLVVAIAMSVFHWSGTRREKRWRGQVVEISSRDSNWWQAFVRRWRVWRRRW